MNSLKVGLAYIGVSTPFYCTDGQGRFLFHKRSKNCRDEQGRWDCGSGQLEFGQDVDFSVLREVREEYGCDGKIVEQLPALSIHRELNGHPTHWVAIPFILLVDPSQVKNNEPESIDELGWFTLDALPSPLHSGLATTMKKYEHFLARYQSGLPS